MFLKINHISYEASCYKQLLGEISLLLQRINVRIDVAKASENSRNWQKIFETFQPFWKTQLAIIDTTTLKVKLDLNLLPLTPTKNITTVRLAVRWSN